MFGLRRAACYGAIVLLLCTVVSQAAPGKPAPSPYRHLVFIRCGGAKTDDLILGTLGDKGLAERKLYGKNNFNVGLQLLGARGGHLYAVKIRDLFSVDLRTGKLTPLAAGVEAHDTAAGRFFWVDGKGAIREYDLRQGRARRVMPEPIPRSYGVQLVASPDGKMLAMFVPTTDVVNGPAQLTVVRVGDGKVKWIGEPVEYYGLGGEIASSFSVRLPFLWTDPEHVAFVRNQGMLVADGGTTRLMQANVVTGEVSEVASLMDLSGTTGVSLERLPAPTLVARTFDGQHRYVIDPRTGELSEEESIGGDFRVCEIHRGDETSWQLYFGEKQLSGSIGQQRPSVSPDGRQVVWVEFAQDTRQLRHFDITTGRTRTLAPGWFGDSFLWLTDRDLAAR